MLGLVVRRLLATIPVMAMVALIVFLHAAPYAGRSGGDHGRRQGPTEARSREIRARAGPGPAAAGAVRGLARALLHGDLGQSFFSKLPVLQLIGQRIGPTLALSRGDHGIAIAAGGAAGRAGRVAARHLARPAGDGLLGAGLLGAGLRARLHSDLRLRDPAGLAAGAGLQAAQSTGSGTFLCQLVLPACTLAVVYIALVARDHPRRACWRCWARITSARRGPRG